MICFHVCFCSRVSPYTLQSFSELFFIVHYRSICFNVFFPPHSTKLARIYSLVFTYVYCISLWKKATKLYFNAVFERKNEWVSYRVCEDVCSEGSTRWSNKRKWTFTVKRHAIDFIYNRRWVESCAVFFYQFWKDLFQVNDAYHVRGP